VQDAPREALAGLIYGLPVVSPARLPPGLVGGDGLQKPSVFISASELKMIALVETRTWVGSVGAIRIGVSAIPGRVVTLLRIEGDEPAALRDALEGWPGSLTSGASLLAEIESGEPMILEGGSVRAVGRFEELGASAVTWNDEIIERLDLTALYRWIEKQVWERSALVGPHGASIATPSSQDLAPRKGKEVGLS
jgi:hypothetical protein